MEAFGFLIMWILSVAFVALGNRSGSRSYNNDCSVSLEGAEAKSRDVKKAMENFHLTKGRRITDAYFERYDEEYVVKIEWEKDGECLTKYIEAASIRKLQDKLKAQMRYWL